MIFEGVETVAEEAGAFFSDETPPRDPRPKTIFCDIDGVLLQHAGTLEMIWGAAQNYRPAPILPGVRRRLDEWERKGYNIILTTGRPECMRKDTEAQLAREGVFYTQLIMGIGGGERHLINDLKPASSRPTAYAHNVHRNVGLESVEI